MKQKFIKDSEDIKDKDVLYYVYDNWNDYGKYLTFAVHYKEDILGSIKIMKPNEEKTIECLEKEGKLNYEFDSETVLNDYYALGNKELYRNLYKNFKKEDVAKLLENINDIAFNTNLIGKISKDENYKVSFLRGINENYIKEFLSRVARGSAVEDFSLEVEYLPAENNTWSSDYKYTFKFDPSKIISSNLHAIIGNNGAGKSRLLRDIAASVVNGKSQKFNSEFLKNRMGPITTTRFSEEEEKARLNNVVYISLSPFDKPSSIFNKLDEETKKVGNQNQIRNRFLTFDTVVKHFESLDDEIVNQIQQLLNKKNLVNIRNIVLDNFYWDRNIKDFLKIIDDYININSNFELENKDSELKKIKTKLRNKFTEMSSGQKSIILILILTLANILENSLLIIDEPENYLHPPYISTLISALEDILQKINGAGIIATHSDVVVQELPKECVHILDEDHKMHSLLNIQTYGNSLDTINEKIFGLDMERTGFYAKLRKLHKDSSKKIEELKESNELGMQAKIFLSLLLEENDGI